MMKTDETTLRVFERKIIQKIFGPVIDNGEYRRRWNNELYELYRGIDVVRRVKIARLRWLGHVSRMDQNEPGRKVFEDVLEGRRKVGRPRLRWKDRGRISAKTWCYQLERKDKRSSRLEEYVILFL